MKTDISTAIVGCTRLSVGTTGRAVSWATSAMTKSSGAHQPIEA